MYGRKRCDTPGPGELAVRMYARPINPSDIIPVRGAYPHRTQLPAVPGFEGIGIVEAVGLGVSNQMLGRRVLDCIGGTDGEQLVSCLKPNGTVISVGLLSGITPLWHEATRGTQVHVKLFWLKHWVERWEQVFHEVMELVRAGRLVMANIGATYDLTNVQQAIAAAESGIEGKVLLLQ